MKCARKNFTIEADSVTTNDVWSKLLADGLSSLRKAHLAIKSEKEEGGEVEGKNEEGMSKVRGTQRGHSCNFWERIWQRCPDAQGTRTTYGLICGFLLFFMISSLNLLHLICIQYISQRKLNHGKLQKESRIQRTKLECTKIRMSRLRLCMLLVMRHMELLHRLRP